ncbi:protein-L-isoaspartate(D-aspartate) O-methyltransferase [Candidatus Woesearchaeota archaeon]|nr:protein-L-isoaspartate(D-aspartate) O-methyltransferase [Candidatus Woesearchaeota archaeon]
MVRDNQAERLKQERKLLLDRWKTTGLITDNTALKAFSSVPREIFVPEQYREQAYHDNALPISAGQTISQPTTVMIITQALELKKGMNALEVGAGSGYQAAIIAKAISPGKIYSTEIIPELAQTAAASLAKAAIKNCRVICKDGSKGYKEASPYDRIVVSAAAREIPNALIEQLKENGIIVAPIGGTYSQTLTKATKKKGKLQKQELGEFVFVPMR